MLDKKALEKLDDSLTVSRVVRQIKYLKVELHFIFIFP